MNPSRSSPVTLPLLGALLVGFASLLGIAGPGALPAAAPGTGGSPAPIVSRTPNVVSQTLANGLRIAVIEDHAAPVVQTALWYRFGSLAERPGKTGLAHALEHMMFRGTRAISGGGLDEIGARLGAVVNANTTEDATHYYFVMPADRLDLALHLEADRMRGLLLRPGDWAAEKGAVLAEYDGDSTQPSFRLTSAVRAAAYAGSPFARTALGVRADVAAARVSDLRRYYDSYYAPNNATLVVTGDVDAATVLRSAQRYFGPLAPRPVPPPPVLAPPPPVRRPIVTLTSDAPSVLLDCAYRIPGDLDAGAAATQVVASLIDSPRSPVYADLVLSRLALNYDAYADTALHAGIFHVVFAVRPGVSAGRVSRTFQATLVRMAQRGIDPDLLAAAKIANAREAIFARDSISGLGDRYGYALGVEGHDPGDDDRAVDALDAAAVNAALRRYFRRPSVIGTLGPSVEPAAAASVAGAPPPGGDSFSDRPPSGPVHLAPWARAAVERPLRLASRIDPHVYRLPNGLRLYVAPVRANPTLFISGNVDISPAFDPPAKTGLGALTGDMLQYGSRNYDYRALQRAGDELGADLHFGLQFGAHGLARDLDRLLLLLADTERRPAFPSAFVALSRDAEAAAAQARLRSPDARAERAFLRALYAPGDPILREETPQSVRAIRVADLRAYARRYLRPDRTTIVIAGDVEPDAVRRAVVRAFGTWHNAGALHDPHPLPPVRTTPAVRYIVTARDTVNVRLGERAIGRRDPDYAALELINNVLGADGTFDTRLMHDIREERGLVYDISSALPATRERGTLEISFSAAPANVAPAVALIGANLRRLRTQPIGAAELTRARTKLVAGTLVSEEATSEIVAGCEFIARYRLSPDYYRTFAARYARYTPADLLRVARKYIRPAQLVEVFEGPRPIAVAAAGSRRR